jgi:hypothetical protein
MIGSNVARAIVAALVLTGAFSTDEASPVVTEKPSPAASSPKPTDATAELAAWSAPSYAEVQTDKLIPTVERDFGKFGERVLPKIAAMAAPEDLKNLLREPFTVMDTNKSNPNKNGVRLDRATGDSRRAVSGGNVYHFSYIAARLREETAAIFFGPTRKMILSNSFNGQNVIDLLVVYHELCHAALDGNERATFKTEADFISYLDIKEKKPGERPKVNAIAEATAYAAEIEILDLLLDGYLRKTISAGENIDLVDVVRRLGLTSVEDIETLNFLLDFAKVYFASGGIQRGNFSGQFVNVIADDAAGSGYDVYVPAADGGMRFIRRGD